MRKLHREDREGGAAGVAQHVLVDDAVVAEAAAATVKVRASVEPDAALVQKYEEKYQKFRALYPALKRLF